MRMQIASISSYAFNDTIFQTIASIISISEIERFDQDESVFDSRFFRISESNWMNTFLWIYSSVELRKEANFKSTGAPIALFSSRWPSHGINALGLPLLPVRERCSTCAVRRRRNVAGLRRCTFDLSSLVDFFDRKIYSSSLIRKTFL